MKKLFFISTLFFVFTSIYAQDDVYINVSSNVTSQEITIEPGEYTFHMSHVDVEKEYEISAIKQNIEINKLETPEGFKKEKLTGSNVTREIKKFKLTKGEKLTITIDVFDITTAAGIRTRSKIKTFTYIYKTKPRGEWRTTFGFNFIYLTNQDTYFSKQNENATYTITEGANRKKFDYHPTLMFTWLPSKFSAKETDVKFALSGGLGYDLESSLSIFFGPSIIYNENITLTFGAAFHNQKRLMSKYSNEQMITDELDFEQLHDDYIRFNPFVSISFRLDRNPFGSN